MLVLDRLLSLAYWASPQPDLPGRAWQAVSLALAGLLLCCLVLTFRARARQAVSAAFWAAESALCMSALAAIGLRLAAVPAASAPIWSVSLTLLALALPMLARFLAPEWPALSQGWQAVWTLRRAPSQPAAATTWLVLALHLVALVVMVRLLRWPAWSVAALLAVLLLPQFAARALHTPHPFCIHGLSALLPAYLLGACEILRRLAFLALGMLPSPLPVPTGPLLIVLAAYAVAYQLFSLWPAARQRAVTALPVLLTVASLGWGGWAYLSLYARGVSGSDPYCYVQMAVDFVRHGTVLHHFPLLGLAQRAQVYPAPLLHIGYREAVDAAGWAPTVWPAGHSVLLGLAGRLAGDGAVYLATPLMALASAAATIWLGVVMFEELSQSQRRLAAVLAGLLVATSFEQVRWVLVHMADISAQLFSTLTIVLAWLAASRGRRVYAIGAGLALALAYWTRHTQLAMTLPALAVLLVARPGRSMRARGLDAAICLGTALVGALPDLIYHHILFGTPLHPESKELALYSLRAVPAMTALLVRGWLAPPELVYQFPLLIAGALALWPCRQACLALGLWLAALWAVQAPYASLRLRDLLPALPALALITGYGAVRSIAWLVQRKRAAAVAVALSTVLLLWLRTAPTIVLPINRGFNNFGYLWASQRQEFASLSQHTEANAVIGATLNSGSIDLYAGRQTFLPAEWRNDELQRFVQTLWNEGHTVYLLDDGLEMAQVLARARGFAQLTAVARLHRIPYYDPAGGSDLRDATLYRVTPPR